MGNPAALGAGTLTLSGAGAALDSSFASLICTTNNPVAVNADFTFNGSQNLNLGTGAVTLGAAAGATGTTRTINVNQNTLTIGGAIGGSGTTQGLAKFGGGTLLFNGQSTYAGPTLISNGTLKIGVSNAVNSGNTVVLSGAPGANDNTTLDLNSFNQAIGTLVMSGVPTNGSNDTSTVTNSNVASPSTLTLTGGASAFYYSYPEYNLPPAAATISVNNLDLNGAPQTFNVVGGANNVTITSVVQDGSLTKTNGGTLFLQGANTYSGTTAIYGGSLQVNNNLGTINQSSAIVIGGGASLVLTNAANQTGVSRVSATAPISSYGGSFQFQNTASAGVAYAQTAGMLTANAGQTDVILNNDQSGTSGASQTLTLSGLAQNGTSVVTFASQPNTNYNNTGLNTSSNVVQVGGVTTATPAGQIIGPWATVGTANSEQRDYAVYNAAGQIVAANGTPTTTDTTWTNASSYYTIGSGTQAQGTTTNITLSANRTMEALRNIGNNDTLTFGAYNLYTYGILHGGQNPFYINSSGGVLSTPTGGGNLYITAGNDWSNPYIQENAPILDNGGAVTVVKSGYQGLYLNGVSTYSGGTVLNAGTTYVNNVNSLGSTASPGTVTFAGGTIDNNSVAGLVFANPLVFNGSGAYGGTGGNSMTFTGPVSLGTAPGAYRSVGVNGGSLVLTGIVSNGTTVNALEKTGNGNLVLDAENMYTGNTILSGGEVQMGVNPVGTAGNVTSSAIGTGAIVFNGGGLASNGVAPRAVLNPVSFNNSSGNQYNAYLGDLASVGKVTFSSTVNLGFAPRGICVNSPVEFDGVVTGSGGVNGGSLVKAGPGLLTLTNASNGYQGPTQVVGGILQPTVAGAIPANTNLLVSSNIGLGTATLDLATNSIPLTVGTLTMGGVTVNNTGPSGNGWSVINTGLATLTLGGDVTYNNTSNPYGATVTGNLALGSLSLVAVSSGTAANWARNFFVNSSGNGQSKPDMTISAAISGPAGVGIYKQSGGMLLLSGNNTYSGATTVNGGSLLITGNNVTTGATAVAGGTLVARSANALGGNANTAVVTVAAGQTFTYNPTSDAQLAIGGNLSIMSTGTVIGVAIGGGTASAAIDVAGAATISGTGSQTINIYGVPGASPATGSYTLIQGGAGSALNSVTAPTLGLVYGNTNFTVGSPAATAAALTVSVTGQTALTTAYWRGGLSGAGQVWAASTGVSGGTSNWATTAGGSSAATQVLVPGPTANVLFFAPIGGTSDAASPNTTTLGSDMSIQGLTLNDFVNNALLLNADGYGLTLGSGGISLLGGLQNQTVTINPSVVLAAAQTWTNNSPAFNPGTPNQNFSNNNLTVNGNVINGGFLLTVNAAAGNNVTINGAISGTGGLTKIGGQTLQLGGASTYSGATTIDYGTIQLTGPGGPGSSPLGSAAGGVYVNGNNATLDLAGISIYTANPLYLNGNNGGSNGNGALYDSSGNAAAWIGPITLQSDSSIGGNVVVTGAAAFTGNGCNLYLSGGGALGNFARVIGADVASLIKTGGGAWRLSAADAYTGPTTVNNGTLKIGVNNAIHAGNSLALVNVYGTPTLDLSGCNQTLGSLTMSSIINNNGQSNVTSSFGPSVLTLTGGASAFAYAVPISGYSAGQATISNVTLDMNGGATFNVADGSANPDVNIASVVQDGSLTKTNGGQLALTARTPTAARPRSSAASCRSPEAWARSASRRAS